MFDFKDYDGLSHKLEVGQDKVAIMRDMLSSIPDSDWTEEREAEYHKLSDLYRTLEDMRRNISAVVNFMSDLDYIKEEMPRLYETMEDASNKTYDLFPGVWERLEELELTLRRD